jgi:hypothetical protein
MNDLRPTLKLPEVPEEEQTPWVKDLVRLVGEQHEYIKTLEAEIRRLTGRPPKPKLRASKMDEQTQGEEQGQGSEGEKVRRPGPRRKKTAELTIHEERKVGVKEELPPGSRFKGYRSYVVQDLEIRPHNTRFLLEQWQTPDGRYITAEVPCAVRGGHYGPTLTSFVLYQYHHNHVTQPLLRQQLTDLGTQISAGQLNTLVTEGHEPFHDEKADLKAAGLEVASYVQTDDTGARHQGRNGYCTYVGNDLFAWFETTFTKSRVNFLGLLQSERLYRLDEQALEYMARHGLGKQDCDILAARVSSQEGLAFSEEKAWLTFLEQRCAILSARAQKVATEGALVAGLLAQGLAADLGIVSDDAGQFNVFEHALCWIHAERAFRGLVPLNDAEFRAIAWVRGQIWALYSDLKAYRDAPDAARKAAIEAGFDALVDTHTVCTPLNQALARLAGNKTELLRVLERPELPLHNNLSERDLRDYVKKRKISASTRSELGRRCRDTFASLKKTCRKHGLSFWDYLVDRVSGTHLVPYLPDLIRNAARE